MTLAVTLVLSPLEQTKPNLNMTLAVVEALSPNKPNQSSNDPGVAEGLSPNNQIKPRYDHGYCRRVKSLTNLIKTLV